MLGPQRRRSEQADIVDMLQDLPWPKLKRRARVDICKADIKKKKYEDAGSKTKKRVLSVVFSEGEAAIEDIVKQADEEVEADVSHLQRSNDSLSSYESGGDDVDTLRTRLASALEANKELQVKLDNSRVGTRLLLACNKALRGKVEELRLDAANKENEFKKIVANDLLSKIENHESAEAQNDLKFDQMRKDKERIELEYKISKLFNSVRGIPVTALNSVQYKINVDKTKLLEGELGFSHGRLNEEKTQSVEKQHSDLVPSNVTKVGGNVQEPQETTAKNRDLILDTRLTKLKKVVRNEKEKNKELHEKLSCLQTMFNTSVQQEQSLKDELANKEADLTRQKSKWVNLLTRLNKEESETLLLYIDNFHLHDQICIFFIHKMFSISSKC